jgi:hypothetical protein
VSLGRLAPKSPAAPSAAPAESRVQLAASVLKGRQHRAIAVPRTDVSGRMRLVTAGEVHEIRAACRAGMAELGITGASIESYSEWRAEFNLRLVATAMRHPAALDQPLATLDEWRQCDPDQIAVLWEAYQDMQAELDPLGDKVELEAGELEEILDLAKKGDVGQLTSFGSWKLARALRSTAAPPPS